MSTNDKANARALLADPAASFLEVQKSAAFLEKTEEGLKDVTLGLSSNVQVDRLALYLRRHALLAGVRLQVQTGLYDSVAQDVATFVQAGVDVLLVLPFFDNLMPAFEAQIAAGLDDSIIAAKDEELAERYRLALAAAHPIPTVLVGQFHRTWPSAQPRQPDRVSAVLQTFQEMLARVVAEATPASLFDMPAILSDVGLSAAIDRRFYAQAKAPYALPMLNEIGRRTAKATRAYGTYFYKVLALDCDNTLWGGVVGEDFVEGIKLSPFEYPGNVYWRAQQEFLGLEKSGVILCLCTKNNPVDVEEVLSRHPDMPIRAENLTIRKINWDDKSTNLRAIATELNVGLDSIVFLDDSSFELEGVQSQIPAVTIFQVPKALTEYPDVVADIKALFLAGGVSAESSAKTQQYKQKAAAEALKAQFSSQEDYIASLELEVELLRNAEANVPRISELTQKSNQFNLTTRRYTQAEILAAMASEDREVYSLTVKDKFGSAGLTGVGVIRYENDVAEVEAFLMSCRVIGRGVEFSIWPYIARDAARRGCSRLRGRFVRSAKNNLVEDFFDQLGLAPEEASEGERTYVTSLATLEKQQSQWIKIHYDG
ncbi:HAD-IIIC family phosphatase [Methylobacterium sp. J-059]|uniref:HAD-IIIC family phosphatase n=1 Tax=Methylobacterium sp. J-059 TaxID=2836643 RepID=UPI001FBAE35F|nr:HAD-IIIC family phosphatase [Methylobacterium sp. J-059]MCJ2042694.1 HAD-IIIC family phosphatase [Methylobacterium sp. J-059]